MATDPDTQELRAWKLLTRVLPLLVATPEDAKRNVKKNFTHIERFCEQKDNSVEHIFRCLKAIACETLKEDGRRAARRQLSLNASTQARLATNLGLDSSGEETGTDTDHEDERTTRSLFANSSTKKKKTVPGLDASNAAALPALFEMLLKNPNLQQALAVPANNQEMPSDAAVADAANDQGAPSNAQARNSTISLDGTPKKRKQTTAARPSTTKSKPRYCRDCMALLPPEVKSTCMECREKKLPKCLDCGGKVSQGSKRCMKCNIQLRKAEAQQRKQDGKTSGTKKRASPTATEPNEELANTSASGVQPNEDAGDNELPKKRPKKVAKDRVCESCKGPISKGSKGFCRECHMKQTKKSGKKSAVNGPGNTSFLHNNDPNHVVNHAFPAQFDSVMHTIGDALNNGNYQQHEEEDDW